MEQTQPRTGRKVRLQREFARRERVTHPDARAGCVRPEREASSPAFSSDQEVGSMVQPRGEGYAAGFVRRRPRVSALIMRSEPERPGRPVDAPLTGC